MKFWNISVYAGKWNTRFRDVVALRLRFRYIFLTFVLNIVVRTHSQPFGDKMLSPKVKRSSCGLISKMGLTLRALLKWSYFTANPFVRRTLFKMFFAKWGNQKTLKWTIWKIFRRVNAQTVGGTKQLHGWGRTNLVQQFPFWFSRRDVRKSQSETWISREKKHISEDSAIWKHFRFFRILSHQKLETNRISFLLCYQTFPQHYVSLSSRQFSERLLRPIGFLSSIIVFAEIF